MRDTILLTVAALALAIADSAAAEPLECIRARQVAASGQNQAANYWQNRCTMKLSLEARQQQAQQARLAQGQQTLEARRAEAHARLAQNQQQAQQARLAEAHQQAEAAHEARAARASEGRALPELPLPSVADIEKANTGDSELDTAARQAAAFDVFLDYIRLVTGHRRNSAPAEDMEPHTAAHYTEFEQASSSVIANAVAKGVKNFDVRQASTHYYVNENFRRSALARFVSQAQVDAYELNTWGNAPRDPDVEKDRLLLEKAPPAFGIGFGEQLKLPECPHNPGSLSSGFAAEVKGVTGNRNCIGSVGVLSAAMGAASSTSGVIEFPVVLAAENCPGWVAPTGCLAMVTTKNTFVIGVRVFTAAGPEVKKQILSELTSKYGRAPKDSGTTQCGAKNLAWSIEGLYVLYKPLGEGGLPGYQDCVYGQVRIETPLLQRLHGGSQAAQPKM